MNKNWLVRLTLFTQFKYHPFIIIFVMMLWFFDKLEYETMQKLTTNIFRKFYKETTTFDGISPDSLVVERAAVMLQRNRKVASSILARDLKMGSLQTRSVFFKLSGFAYFF